MSTRPFHPIGPAGAAEGPMGPGATPPLPPRKAARRRRRDDVAGSVAAHLMGALARCRALARPASRVQGLLVLALLVADVAMMAAFVAFAYAEHYQLRHSPFYGNLKLSFVDGGYPEIYGYGKQALVAGLLLVSYAATRQAVYRALGLLFVVVAIDDAFAVHEALGKLVAAATGMSVNLGEIVSWAAIGLVPMLVVAAGFRSSDSRSRIDAAAVLTGFAILLFFAVGMDVVHGLVGRYVTGFQTVLTLAEDGGELLALTLICALAIGIFRQHRDGARGP